jgi:fructokinase
LTATQPADENVIAVVGETLVDLVQAGPGGLFEALPGGSPANVAVGLARLEIPARMVARIGDDLLGRWIRDHLTANNVDLSFAVAADELSSLAIVAVGRDGSAEYEFRVDGTADWQWHDDELERALDRRVLAVHSGSLALTIEPGAGVITRLLARARATSTISYDPNCRPLLMGRPEDVLHRVHALLAVADVVKASAEDIAWLLPGREPEAVVTEWLAHGPAVVAITLGSDGVVAAGRAAGLVRRPGRPVRVVDTVGAGDSFTSALLAGLHRRSLLGAANRGELRDLAGAALAALLDEAVLASSITCTRRGAEPPTTADMADATSRTPTPAV